MKALQEGGNLFMKHSEAYELSPEDRISILELKLEEAATILRWLVEILYNKDDVRTLSEFDADYIKRHFSNFFTARQEGGYPHDI